jgi:hypothetical protein
MTMRINSTTAVAITYATERQSATHRVTLWFDHRDGCGVGMEVYVVKTLDEVAALVQPLQA